MNLLKGGRPFSSTSPNLKALHARHSEYDTESCLHVVETKAKQWLDSDGMRRYFRPSTLFRPSHFDEYLAEDLDPPKREPERQAPKPDQLVQLCCRECGRTWERVIPNQGQWEGALPINREGFDSLNSRDGSGIACEHSAIVGVTYLKDAT